MLDDGPTLRDFALTWTECMAGDILYGFLELSYIKL